jgi:hypothetical protein
MAQFFSPISPLYLNIIQLRERAFDLHPYSNSATISSLLYDQAETTLNLSQKFSYMCCSPMKVPIPTQPNVEPELLNQTHIALNLFNTILKTTTNQVELEQSWAAIE